MDLSVLRFEVELQLGDASSTCYSPYGRRGSSASPFEVSVRFEKRSCKSVLSSTSMGRVTGRKWGCWGRWIVIVRHQMIGAINYSGSKAHRMGVFFSYVDVLSKEFRGGRRECTHRGSQIKLI
jgi:hypothetical protein